MSNKPNRKKLTNESSIHWPTVILISGVVALLIPLITMGLIFFDAFEGTGSTLDGNRFANELTNELTTEQVSQIETSIKDSDSSLELTVHLKSATLRISALVANDMSEEDMIALTKSMMDKVYQVAPAELYFKNNASYKQYDLEVHVFNDKKVVEDENYIYVLGHLNATMEEQQVQVVSKPLDPEFVADLYQRILDKQNENENENPEENPEATPDEGTGDTEGE